MTMKKKPVYLDNAATSWPKPESVTRAIQTALTDIGANPGRGGYAQARAADRLLYDTRVLAARFFNAPDPARVIFTPGATFSLNMALRGLFKKGDHAIVMGRQHNAVIRPLHDRRLGVKVSRLAWNGSATLGKELARLQTKKTRALIVNHAGNVDGFLYPLEQIGRAVKKRGLTLIVDAAQSAGNAIVDMQRQNIGILCVTGHKGLLGPTGTGLLLLNTGIELEPLISGGTGSFSDRGEMPAVYPDRLEAGSLNLAGIAGLGAGMRELVKLGLEKSIAKKMRRTEQARTALSKIPGIRFYWSEKNKLRIPLFSFTIDGLDPAEVGDLLDHRHNIACRVGLHCAPDAHREIGSFPEGTVRFAPGIYTTTAEVEHFIRAVREIAGCL